jgi:hypothetical protein
MSKRENFYRRDPSKALSGMIGLSLEERGVYNTVLDLLYSTWRPIENDRRFIANWCGCAVQKLNPILDRLIDKGRLITFEEGGRTYVSDEAFEDERNAVKGAASTRSGRREVGEKSGEVGEKSASVGQNLPLLDTDIAKNQSLTALDKRREEKKEEANASLSPRATKAPTTRSYPEAFDAAWKEYPHHKGRSSKPNAAAVWAKLPAEERAGLVAAVRRFAPNVGETCGGKGAPDMAVWLKDGKHLNWQAEETGGDSSPSFDGPPELRARIVALKDDAFARRWLDHYCRWRAADRTILAVNATVAETLRAELAGYFAERRIRVEVAAANDTPMIRREAAA